MKGKEGVEVNKPRTQVQGAADAGIGMQSLGPNPEE